MLTDKITKTKMVDIVLITEIEGGQKDTICRINTKKKISQKSLKNTVIGQLWPILALLNEAFRGFMHSVYLVYLPKRE